MKVCLDAGHYGNYNRSPAVPEYCESKQMWTLHLLLKDALTRRGVAVITTRAEQAKDMPLTDRGRAAKGCDLFLSLHSNAVGSRVDENVDYPVSYVMLDGTSTEIGQRLANCVRQVMGTRQSGRTATRRGTNGEYYGVLRGAAAVRVPGVILEHSFHTQTRASRWLMSDANLKKLAEAEADVIVQWLMEQKGEEPVTYEQFVEYMERYEKEKAAQPATWEGAVMDQAATAGLITGGRPKSNITRGEMAQVLKNARLM